MLMINNFNKLPVWANKVPVAAPLPTPPATPANGAAKNGKPFDQMSREEKQQAVADAFDRRDKAESVIRGRMMQAYVGWDPKTDKGYQEALAQRDQANQDIARYRKTEPDMVALEEERHTTFGQVKSFFGKVGSFLSGLFSKGNPFPSDNPLFM